MSATISTTTTEALEEDRRRVKGIRDNDRGDILVRVFWTKARDYIVDVRVTDADNASNGYHAAESALQHHEKD